MTRRPGSTGSIRLLGRSGVMNVTLVGDAASFTAAEAAADSLLTSNFRYVAGERYAEFKEGDKIAEYDLAALVLGGAGALALKPGLLANLGLLFGKFLKFIAVGVVAFFGFFKKLWNKITGKNAPPLREEDQ
ncbi:MAG: DUF2167 domain-containing protein [Candidatus Synoicihabitans palmerolidicus]|nr:DUF2167 domain-containing protein [Candidatus Synoicihabitans palmerolidicus]